MIKDHEIPQVLYRECVLEEIKARESGEDREDYELADKLIEEINTLGYNFKYLTDFNWYKVADKRIVDILKKYILNFNNLGISEDLLNLVSHKGFFEATQMVLDLYELIKERLNPKYQCECAGCDNALHDIADRRFESQFLEYYKSETDAVRLSLTMELLGKWKNEQAKLISLVHLKSDNREVVFTALDVIKYFKGDKICKEAVSPLCHSKDKDIASLAKKVIKKL